MSEPQAFALSADLTFSADVPGRGLIEGTLTASGRRMVLRVSGPLRAEIGRGSRALRAFATTLAQAGATLVVYVDDVELFEVGDTRPGWWQRRLTRSRHVRMSSARGVIRLVRRGEGIAADDLLPPFTLLPLAPTFGAARRPVTTTHDPRRGGNPRLVLVSGESLEGLDSEVVFPLRNEVTTIGSGERCDIRIAGLEETHAVVIHDERDELVVHDRSTRRTTRVNGAPAGQGTVLRTGTRVEVGDAILVYRRAEYADHGRPFGGRVGGELGHQRPQPDPRHRGTSSGRSRLAFPLKLRSPR
ncbi:MAG: FHA domain-containing protein [Marmoricola sp.]